jgi:multisubunit Na+/H+ antiporter MnhB subunit
MSRDLNKYTNETIRRLVYGTLIILFTVGLGLIWVFYGARAAGLGLLCLVGASVPVLLVIGVIFGMDFFMRKMDKK